jgi:hypothetical protein
LITELVGTLDLLSLRVAENGRDVWALSGGGIKLLLYRVNVASKAIISTADVSARGTGGVIDGELGGRVVLRTWSAFDPKRPSLYLSDGTDADTRWIRNALNPGNVAVMDGSIYYVAGDNLFRVEGTSAASAVTFLGKVNFFNQTQSPLTAAASQLHYADPGTSQSFFFEGRLGAYRVDRSVEGYAYGDANGNGERGVGEAGLSGWRVFIDKDGDGFWDANETYVRTTATGKYVFTDLPAGTIRLTITQVGGYTPTSPTSYTVAVSPGVTPRRHFGMKPTP